METNRSQKDPSPSKLQEAVDAIAGEFDYPDSLTIEYQVRGSGEKRTQFIISTQESDADSILVLSHDATSDHPELASES
ncbi:hypothetical protein ACFR9U_20355 [Halorientalis brevis]|uniref:Halobacterial output domain-containing protein n=1 Tax=Halorientalis brevis TaxID=1126241 RepID=A0ABD6CGH6_9EURY|nr:hypothetical protein [Halorientalis brevis]